VLFYIDLAINATLILMVRRWSFECSL